MYIRASIYIAGSDNNDIDAVYINGARVALLVFGFLFLVFCFLFLIRYVVRRKNIMRSTLIAMKESIFCESGDNIPGVIIAPVRSRKRNKSPAVMGGISLS